MPVNRQTVRIDLNHTGEVVSHVLDVTPGDCFRAEIEGRKQGVPAPSDGRHLAHLTVQLWCAAVREGIYDRAFQDFPDHLYDFEQLNDPEPVDPTEARSEPDSPSPTTSPDPSTGSTPTSTPA